MLVCLIGATRCESSEGDCGQVGRRRTGKLKGQTGGGGLIAEDQGPVPGPGPGPAFV